MRTGDTVRHGPTSEEWIVAYVDGDRLAWCGWPEGEALMSDCTLVRECTDEQHWEWVARIAASVSGKRASRCQAMLAELFNAS